MSIEYHGKTFPGYNQPIKSDRPEKKMMVLAKKGDEVRLIHFGQKGYKHNYSAEGKKDYLSRSAGIRDKSGNLTKDDKFSANYWARKVLWPKGKTGEGHSGPIKTSAVLPSFFDELEKIAEEGTATKSNPSLWERMKAKATAKMGGKHSARAMQLATKLYKDAGGGYKGKKPSSSSNKMVKWTKQDWQTRPGTPERAERSDGSTARYLPKKKWESLSKKEQVATDRKKLRASEQFVSNTPAARVSGSAKYH